MICHVIQGLPVRCNSAALSTLLGVVDIAAMIKRRQLSFIGSIINMDSDSLAKKIMTARVSSPGVKGITVVYEHLLSDLNLPDLVSVLKDPPKKSSLKSFVKKQTAIYQFPVRVLR